MSIVRGLRPQRWKPKPERKQTVGPWDGVCDAPDPQLVPRTRLNWAENAYPTKGGWEQRPGFVRSSTTLAGNVQGCWQYSKLNGTEKSIVIAGGKVYTITWNSAGAHTLTESVNAAALSGASITLSSTNRVYFTTFNDLAIVTDGANTPWAWNGTTNGGLTELTNAPVAYGRPTVYYAKLFFIKATARRTIVWSEELQENTGYEAGGFVNVWQLGQSDQDALYCIYGTNDALLYFRDGSIGAISGRVTTEFRTKGTHDEVSPSVGTRSPDGVLKIGQWFYFLDQELRPQRMTLTGGVQGEFEGEPLFADCLYTTRRNQIDRASLCTVVWDSATNLVVMTVGNDLGTSHATALNYALTFDAATGRFVGAWTFATVTMGIALLLDPSAASGDRKWRLVHGDASSRIYTHGLTRGSSAVDMIWFDTDSSGASVAITARGLTGKLGFAGEYEQDWERVSWGVRAAPLGDAAEADAYIAAYSNDRSFESTVIAVDGAKLSTPTLPGPAGFKESQVNYGVGFQARWIQAGLRLINATVATQPVAFNWCTATAVGAADAPTAK